MQDPSTADRALIAANALLEQRIRELEHADSERKRAEAALRESEERFRRVFEQGPLGMITADVAQGRFTAANAVFCQMLGYTEDELKHLTFADVTHPDHLAQDVAAVKKLWAGQIPHYKTEKRYRRKNGETLWGSLTASVIRDSDGTPLYSLAMIEDVTERKRNEQALRESERRLRDITSSIGDWVWEVDANGVYTYSSPRGDELLGPAVGKTPFDFMPPDEAKRVGATFADIVGRRAPIVDLENWNVAKNGDLVCLLTNGVPILDAAGNLTGYRGVDKDITTRKRAEAEKAALEAQLHQAQKMESVGRLAGGVAHDFNNMLGVILGHVEMAIQQIPAGQPLHADLLEVHAAAKRSAGLTRQLLAFARKQTVAPQVLHVDQHLSTMLAMLQRLIGENVELTMRHDAELWPIRMDPSQLDQIVTNLCVNARDAIADVGRIAIEAGNVTIDRIESATRPGSVPGEFVRLAVSDNGCGMDGDTLRHIFEPFFTTKDVGSGTGLGLSTVYGMVTQNDGFIDVASQPGQGTTFTIYLPRYLGKAAQASSEAALGTLRRGAETILLVEDEPAILRLATKMLERQGYTVLPASTPGEAIQLAREYAGEIHLLMTDVIMPEMNGRELAKNLLSLYPRLSRLFMSGYTADVIAHHGVLEPGTHFLEKPFSMDELAAKVRAALTHE